MNSIARIIKSASKKKQVIKQEPQYIKDAVIIAGGIGSRLSPITDEIVKPLVPVQGIPVAEHLVNLFKHYGVTTIYFSVCHKPHQIRSYFGSGKRYGMKFKYLDEKEPKGTAFSLRLLKRHCNKTIFMTNADELKDINLKEMAKQHKETKAKLTIALTSVEDPSAYGVAKLDGNQIKEFVEKPKNAPSSYINSGFYIVEPEIFQLVPNKKTMIETAIFPVLAKENKLYGFKFDGQWFDTGTIERYKNAIQNWKGFSWE